MLVQTTLMNVFRDCQKSEILHCRFHYMGDLSKQNRMLFLRAIVFLTSFISVEGKIYVYDTHDGVSVQFYDCIFVRSLPYCRRPVQPITLTRDNDTESCEKNSGTVHSMGELRSTMVNVSTVLHEWKSSIESAERYSRYRRDSLHSVEYLCQCRRERSFGKSCEYLLPAGQTMDETLDWQLDMKTKYPREVQKHGKIVCYQTLDCDSGLLCLDWREICDGIQQCTSGVDESNCDLLELNVCDDDEYRCMNGLCIPDRYFLDGVFDCLDWSDEMQFHDDGKCALESVSSQCDDRFCPPNQWSCGDGQCIHNRLAFQIEPNLRGCLSERDQYFMCETHYETNKWTIPNGRCHSGEQYQGSAVKNRTGEELCQYLLKCTLSEGAEKDCPCWRDPRCAAHLDRNCSLDLIQYPDGGIIAANVFFLYNRRRNWNSFWPDWVLINGTFHYRGFSIQINQTIPFTSEFDVRRVLEQVLGKATVNLSVIASTNAADQCPRPNDSLDLCNESKVCISTSRINDGFNDCLNGSDERAQVDIETSCSRVKRHRFRCSIDQPTCLSVTALGNRKRDCRQGFDELWLGGDGKLSELNCNDRWTDGCSILRQYIEQSWTLVERNATSFAWRIPFRSYCDTFWNLGSKEDEKIADCRRWWICDEGQWQCRTGQCIDLSWVSDNEWDCADASDEETKFNETIKSLQQKQSVRGSINGSEFLMHICNQTHPFLCLSLNASHPQPSCIDLHRIGDQQTDCAGASDERNTLEHCLQPSMLGYHFKCLSSQKCIPYWSHCQPNHRCPDRTDDEVWCSRLQRQPNCTSRQDFICFDGQCIKDGRCNQTLECPAGEDEYMCDYQDSSTFAKVDYRSEKEFRKRNGTRVLRLPRFPATANTTEPRPDSADEKQLIDSSSQNSSSLISAYWCNRGIGLLTSNSSIVCFCPSQYYGERCEYHADRLTVLLDLDLSQSIYVTRREQILVLKALVLFLFENQTLMVNEFHVRPTGAMMPVTKRIMHFFYSRSPTALQQRRQRYGNRSLLIHSHPYSVRIEIYEMKEEKEALLAAVAEYPITFDYLPVFRLAKVLRLTQYSHEENPCSNHPCQRNQRCHQLINDRSKYICLCSDHLTGDNCSIEDKQCANSHCAPKALCKPTYQRLIQGDSLPYCICPYNWHGDRCDLEHERCKSNPCQNGGFCFPRSTPDEVSCSCTDRYTGAYCERERSHVLLSLVPHDNLEYAGAVLQWFRIDFISLDLILVHQEVHRVLPPFIEYRHKNKAAPEIILARLYSSRGETLPALYLLSLHLNVASIDGTTEITERNRCPDIRTLSERKQFSRISFRVPLLEFFQTPPRLNIITFAVTMILCFVFAMNPIYVSATATIPVWNVFVTTRQSIDVRVVFRVVSA